MSNIFCSRRLKHFVDSTISSRNKARPIQPFNPSDRCINDTTYEGGAIANANDMDDMTQSATSPALPITHADQVQDQEDHPQTEGETSGSYSHAEGTAADNILDNESPKDLNDGPPPAGMSTQAWFGLLGALVITFLVTMAVKSSPISSLFGDSASQNSSLAGVSPPATPAGSFNIYNIFYSTAIVEWPGQAPGIDAGQMVASPVEPAESNFRQSISHFWKFLTYSGYAVKDDFLPPAKAASEAGIKSTLSAVGHVAKAIGKESLHAFQTGKRDFLSYHGYG